AQMERENLFRFIQLKAQKCLQKLSERDQVEEYLFWQIMELFCIQSGKVMMSEVACLLFQCYMLLRKKTSKQKGERIRKEWCIPLARLLCTSAPDDELREAVVKMGDDLASKGLTYAAHICYVVVKMELGSRRQFELIGCDRLPFGLVVLSEAIVRTETYEYALSLTSGLAQPIFQIFKLFQASRLAHFELSEIDFSDVVCEYCETITRAAMTFPDKILRSFVERLILLSLKVRKAGTKEPEWLLDLQQLHKTKLANANANVDPEQATACASHEEVSENQDPFQSYDLERHTDPEAVFNARYLLGERLGVGGYGCVYTGIRTEDRKQVAIKAVDKTDSVKTITFPGQMQALPLEVVLMKMVSKPPCCKSVVDLLDWFDLPNMYMMVLEWPRPCMDLWDFVVLKKGYLTEAQIRKIMLQVIQAARHCCDRGVFHRDIKVNNLIINPSTMEVKLIDFGCGEILKDTPYQNYSGTKGYYPPEWLINREYMGIPATIWSLGIVLYILVYGNYPIKSMDDFFSGHVELRPDISRESFDLMMWCLDLNPEMRPGFDDLLRHEWFTEAVQDKLQ
ncbi:aurora kinase-like isoform X1, partial [Clarias magur]